MKNVISVIILLLVSSHNFLYAQKTPVERPFLEHVRFGGSLGLSFSDGFFNVGLAPKAVYDFNKYTSMGVGLMGSYSSASNYKAYNYGASVLGLLRPFPALQLSAELEELHVSRNFELDGGNRKESYWYPSLFLGLGYTTGQVTIGMRYDVLYDAEKSIYGNALMPFVSIYF